MKKVMQSIRVRWTGVALSAVVGLVAYGFGRRVPLVGGPVAAIVLGMALRAISMVRPSMAPGLAWTSKKLLQWAVVFLGFGLSLRKIAQVGASGFPVLVGTVAAALLTAYAGAKLFCVSRDAATLIGVGSAICGGSAIAATAPVIEADDETVASAISVIFFFNILAALLFPTMGKALGFSDAGFGLFAGTAVNDTSSVTAAAGAWDAMRGLDGEVLRHAAIVKLTRTLFILPITVALSAWRGRGKKKRASVPGFILAFLGASLLTSAVGWIGGDALALRCAPVFRAFSLASKFLIVMAMAAIGAMTDIVHLVRTGGRKLLLGGLCWLVITASAILLQRATGTF